jgi:hypothetical protein
MGRTITAVGALVMFLSGFMAFAASGEALPSATLLEQGSGNSVSYSGGNASISYDGTGPSSPGGASGSISLTYWIEVVGPANVSVPIDFLSNGTATASNQKTSSAVTASFGTNPSLDACANSGAGPCAPNTFFSGLHQYTIATNVPVEVQLTGSWFSGCCGDGVFGGGQAHGFANSFVEVDPTFGLSGYTLQWSADLSPASVPEPSTYALMLGALGLVAFLARRREIVERHAAGSFS